MITAIHRHGSQIFDVQVYTPLWLRAFVRVKKLNLRMPLRSVAHMLVEMRFGEFPMALGVLYDDPRPTFNDAVTAQNASASEGKTADLGKLLGKGQTWTVAEGHPEI